MFNPQQVNYRNPPLIRCPTHSKYELTNICMSTGCIEPLCPECFSQHLNMHNESGTLCKVETLNSMRDDSLDYVLKIIGNYEDHQRKLEKLLEVKINPNEEEISKLRKAKEKIIELVNSFFENLEDEYKKAGENFRETHYEECRKIKNRIEEVLEEFKSLYDELNGQDYIKHMLKIFMEGFSVDHQTFNLEVQKLFDSWGGNKASFNCDDSKLLNIKEDLSKYAQFRSKKPNIIDPLKNSLKNNKPIISEIIYTTKTKESKENIDKSNVQSKKQTSPKKLGFSPLKYQYEKPTFSFNKEKVKINQISLKENNFFVPDCKKKHLCFFQDNSKKYHYIDLNKISKDNPIPISSQITLNINFKIPLFHRSIITSLGDIYLCGGFDCEDRKTSLSSLYYLDFENGNLIEMSNMIEKRAYHSICVIRTGMLVVGGITNLDEDCLKSGEIFDFSNRNWRKINDCNFGFKGSSLCSFSDKFVFKFGGGIEKYDIEDDIWTDIKIERNEKIFDKIEFYGSYCTNESEMIIFGGNGSWIVKNNENEGEIEEFKVRIPFEGEFWNQIILEGEIMFALQNVKVEGNQQLYYFGKRRVLGFNGKNWKEINMIS